MGGGWSASAAASLPAGCGRKRRAARLPCRGAAAARPPLRLSAPAGASAFLLSVGGRWQRRAVAGSGSGGQGLLRQAPAASGGRRVAATAVAAGGVAPLSLSSRRVGVVLGLPSPHPHPRPLPLCASHVPSACSLPVAAHARRVPAVPRVSAVCPNRPPPTPHPLLGHGGEEGGWRSTSGGPHALPRGGGGGISGEWAAGGSGGVLPKGQRRWRQRRAGGRTLQVQLSGAAQRRGWQARSARERGTRHVTVPVPARVVAVGVRRSLSAHRHRLAATAGHRRRRPPPPPQGAPDGGGHPSRHPCGCRRGPYLSSLPIAPSWRAVGRAVGGER